MGGRGGLTAAVGVCPSWKENVKSDGDGSLEFQHVLCLLKNDQDFVRLKTHVHGFMFNYIGL